MKSSFQFAVSAARALLLAITVTTTVHGGAFATEIHGRVVAVADGDTLTVLDRSNRQHRVRLANIDAPESHQAFGQKAKKGLSDACFAASARVVVVDMDTQYNRVVGDVFCARDGGATVHANREQVRQGLAWAYTRYLRDPAIAPLQAQAQGQRMGLWSDAHPVPPWEFRRENKSTDLGAVLARLR